MGKHAACTLKESTCWSGRNLHRTLALEGSLGRTRLRVELLEVLWAVHRRVLSARFSSLMYILGHTRLLGRQSKILLLRLLAQLDTQDLHAPRVSVLVSVLLLPHCGASCVQRTA